MSDKANISDDDFTYIGENDLDVEIDDPVETFKKGKINKNGNKLG